MAAMRTALWLKIALVCLGLLSVPAALAQSADNRSLRIYGLALDETRLGDGFCETCAGRSQALPKVVHMEVQTTPAPYVALTLEPDAAARPRDVRISGTRRARKAGRAS
jgi:hypothetical protein